MRRSLIIVTLGLAVYYLIFRALYTLNPDQMFFSLLFYAAELHGFVALILFLFDIWRPEHPQPTAPEQGLTVDVYIPTYNEDTGLLRRTALGAKSIRYPHKTYILDDGDRPEVRDVAAELGIEYIAREEHNHAKAGNINHALRKTAGDFIAIFDADHVPQPEFLDRTMGFFNDPEMAFVQTPQFFYNLSAFEEFSNTATDEHWEQQSMFFHYLQPGKQHWNSAFFCGTCAVIRRSALDEVGGIATDTITEDIHTSVLLHARGWKSTYLDEHLATGLAPTDVISYFKQRMRWALGNLRVLFIRNPLTTRGLSLPQRISYFSAMFCWTIGFQKIIYYLTPPLMLLTPLMPIDRFFTSLVGLYFANLLLQLFTYKALTGGRGRIFMDELFNMLNYWFLIRSFFRAMFGLGQSFAVTSKGAGAAEIPVRLILPQLAVAALCLSGIAWWLLKIIHGINLDMLSSSIAAFWTLYVLALAAAACARALRKYDVRSDYRFRDSIPVWYRDRENRWMAACTADFNTQGMSLISYAPLPMDGSLQVRMMTDAGTLETAVRVLYKRPNNRLPDVHSYGAKFENLPPEGRDLLNVHAMNRTVPAIMRHIYSDGKSRLDWLKGFLPYRLHSHKSWMGLPISTIDRPGEWAPARIENADQRNLTILAGSDAEAGSEHGFLLLSPYGPVRGRMRIQGAEQSEIKGLRRWRVYLETMAPEDAARFEKLLDAK